MKILGLDSSGLVATVAIVEDDILLGEYTINYKKTHSQTLLPMLDVVVKMLELDLNSIDAIAVAKGPGSFTGLRIGSATAKGLGLALNKPIVGVPTLMGLAYNLYGTSDVICPIMDARRNQVYTGIYEFVDEVLEIKMEQSALDIHQLVSLLNDSGKKVILLGDGVPVYQEVLKEELQVPFSFAPAHMNRQRASCVATLGMKLWQEGKFEPAVVHQPEYLRKSQAEREREERLHG